MQDVGWKVEVRASTLVEWSEMLDLFSDANLYQTWSYGSIRWGSKNLSHLILKRGGEVLGVAQVRIVRPTRFKFGMAYLRWGPLFERRGRPLDPEIAARMACALEEQYVVKRRLFMRILPNAFAGTPRASAFQAAFSRFAAEPLVADNTYRTLVLDLAPSMEELRRKLDAKWRNQLARAEKNGLKVVAGTGNDEFAAFSLLYNEMRRRKAFKTTVGVDEFARVQSDLPESQRMQVLICEDKGVPVAGIVAAAMGDSAIYVLGATGDQGLNSKGTYLLQWTLIKWLKERGVRWYDLGGIDPEANPGVYHFKKGMSGADVYQISPLVAHNNAFSAAVVRAGIALQRGLRGAAEAFRTAQNLKSLGAGA